MQRLINASALPRAELRLRLMAAARAALIDGGYRAIGLDHFALPHDDLARAAEGGTLNRNFQGYTTTNVDALIGLGLSAISDLPSGYFQNQRKLPDYHQVVTRPGVAVERGVLRTGDDRLRGEIIRDLMCRFRLDMADVAQRFGISFEDRFAPELDELRALEEQGLVQVGPAMVDLTPLGTVFVRNVARVFDAYRRAPATAERPRFSSTG